MKQDKNNKTFSERFDEEFVIECDPNEFYIKEKNPKKVKQFFISELKSIDNEIGLQYKIYENKLYNGMPIPIIKNKEYVDGYNKALDDAQQIIKKRI
jgi:hypothetical protein